MHVDSTSVTVDQQSVTIAAFDATDLAPNDSLAIELTWAPTTVTTLSAHGAGPGREPRDLGPLARDVALK